MRPGQCPFPRHAIRARGATPAGRVTAHQRLQFDDRGFIHSDRLHKREVVEAALCAHGFRRQAELVAECTSERFVRTVAGIERHGQDVGGTDSKTPRRLGQTPTAHIPHDGVTSRHTECAQQVIARNASAARDLGERQVAVKPGLDEPQCSADRMGHRHTATPRGTRPLDRGCGDRRLRRRPFSAIRRPPSR